MNLVNWKRFKQFLGGFLTLALIVGPEPSAFAKDSTVISYNSLTRQHLDTLLVARVGNIKISAREFLLSYEYGPAFVKRGENPLRHHLEFMINEKLLTLDALSKGLQNSSRVKETLHEIVGDLATEELFKDDVMSKVRVSDAEIERAVAKEKKNIAIKWLFTTSTNRMKYLSRQIRNGSSFNSLFRQQLNDSVTTDDRSLETTLFKLDTRNAALAKIVDTLTLGKISRPNSAPDGWYFVQLVNAWTNPITTESEENKLRYEARRALFQHKMDMLSDEYVKKMMRKFDPVIIRKTVVLLRSVIGGKILPPEKIKEWDLNKKILEEFGPVDISKITARGNVPLVRMREGSIQLKRFLTWYRTRETNIKLNTSSRGAFFLSLQKLIWRMIRDELLMRRAFNEGLQERSIVKTQKKWWRDKLLYAVEKSNLVRSLHPDDAVLKAFYRQNVRQYRDRSGKREPFDKVKADVWRDYTAQEANKKLLHRILRLKQQNKIVINNAALNFLSRRYRLKRNPEAVEFYVVKKGGTFPRPAFPSIDFAWKSWY